MSLGLSSPFLQISHSLVDLKPIMWTNCKASPNGRHRGGRTEYATTSCGFPCDSGGRTSSLLFGLSESSSVPSTVSVLAVAGGRREASSPGIPTSCPVPVHAAITKQQGRTLASHVKNLRKQNSRPHLHLSRWGDVYKTEYKYKLAVGSREACQRPRSVRARQGEAIRYPNECKNSQMKNMTRPL
jgi:hypothetical protein